MNYKIQHIDLHLSTESFYCPVTGKLLFQPEYFDPSPAIVFNYYDDFNEFNEATDEIEQLYEECLDELKIETPEDNIPFEKLINEKLEKYYNRYLMIEMGDIYNNLFYCFDLAHNPENKVLNNTDPIPTQHTMHEAVFNMEIDRLFCPATGQELVNSGNFSPSPSLEFIYSHSTQRFKLINDSLRNEYGKYFSGFDDLSEKDLYQELTSEIFAEGNKHFLITYGSNVDQITICVDMADPEFSPRKTFEMKENIS